MGVNTLSTSGIATSSTIEASHVTQFYTALDGALVPRASGAPTSDGGALGSTTYMWSDLFLASGAVINFNNGDVTITHSSGALSISGNLAFSAGGGVISSVAEITFSSDSNNNDVTSDFIWITNGSTELMRLTDEGDHYLGLGNRRERRAVTNTQTISTAKTIYSFLSTGNGGHFVVHGRDEVNGNRWVDMVVAGNTVATAVSSTDISGTPGSRTYSMSSTNLQLVYGGGNAADVTVASVELPSPI